MKVKRIEVASGAGTESMWSGPRNFDGDSIVTSWDFMKFDMSCKDILSAKGLLAMLTREWLVLHIYTGYESVWSLGFQKVKLTAPFMSLYMALAGIAA